ncbi:unnamed protein product [Brachionus calyciflorus]|uniref:DNA 5'-3' helicase n=1 Tax=Brachionus calyciflorus TaxID=104777 RepID=A0A813VIB9_9BILA|nr:unnamed protein product [Brachionus calyciflorus]
MSSTEEAGITIGGIKVRFPKKPYPCQISMMDKIIRGLQRRQNCLLESPTGSGKTLSLLCSTLGWQRFEKEAIRSRLIENDLNHAQKVKESCYCDCGKKKPINKEKPSLKNLKKKGVIYEESSDESMEEYEPNEAKNDCPCVCHGMYQAEPEIQEHQKSQKVPTIYFTTRTHKQITNVIKEFKKTPYANEAKMTILASRAHSCIHPQISKLSNKDEMCKKLNKDKSIGDLENKNESSEKPDFGGGCTFYNRFKKQPLSYESYGFKQSVWDIEDLIYSFKRKRLCPYYGARELMPVVDIIFCPYNYLIDPRIRSSMNINLKDQIVIVDEAHNIEDACRESTTFFITKFQLENGVKELREISNWFSDEKIHASAMYFLQVFERLIDWVERCSLNMEQRDFDASMSKILNGIEMIAEFKFQGIGPDNYATFKKHLSDLNSDTEGKEREKEIISDAVKVLINQIDLMLEFLYMENHEFMEDFRVAITKTKIEEPSENDENSLARSTQFKAFAQQAKWTFTINFWCLNPAVAFYYLKHCHSVILCSGTLSPMDTFQSELGVKFEHQLEANHVISDKQVWVGSMGYGPTDVNLLATFKTFETYAFQDEIGRLTLDVCKTIPYGVLCFVPSYSLLTKLMNRWNENGITKQIKTYKKVFFEPRVAKNFDDLLREFYDSIESSTGGEKNNGALMLAVYRGRASEGLDFSDNYARAVIAVGIPYPNIKDIQVDLKRKYNNNLSVKKNLLKGDDWYEIQAYRAVNQALGRCIRHRNDWGAIILVDDRYFKNPQKYSKGLSKWIRQRYKTFRNYSQAMDSLKNFSQEMINFKGDFHPTQQSQAILPLNDTDVNSLSQRVNETQLDESKFSQIKEENLTIISGNISESKLDSNKNSSKRNFFTSTQYSQKNDSPLNEPKSSKKRSRDIQENNKISTPNFKIFQYTKENKFNKPTQIEEIVLSEEEDEDGIVYLDNTELEIDEEFEADFSIVKKQKKNKETSIEEI